MIKVESDKCVKSIRNLENTLRRKLKHMVSGFIYEFSLIAVDNTPYGNVESFLNLYKYRAKVSPYPVNAGVAKAGWQIDINTKTDNAYNDYADSSEASNVKQRLKNEAFVSFKLGDKINLGNAVPYVTKNNWPLPGASSLESGASSQAPSGIIRPTLQMLTATYRINLVNYFKKG